MWIFFCLEEDFAKSVNYIHTQYYLVFFGIDRLESKGEWVVLFCLFGVLEFLDWGGYGWMDGLDGINHSVFMRELKEERKEGRGDWKE